MTREHGFSANFAGKVGYPRDTRYGSRSRVFRELTMNTGNTGNTMFRAIHGIVRDLEFLHCHADII